MRKNVGGCVPYLCGSAPRHVSVSNKALLVRRPRSSKGPEAIPISRITSLSLSVQETNTMCTEGERARSASDGVGKLLIERDDGPNMLLTLDVQAAKELMDDLKAVLPTPPTPPLTPAPSPSVSPTRRYSTGWLKKEKAAPIVQQAVVKQTPVVAPVVPPSPQSTLHFTEPFHTRVHTMEEGQAAFNFQGIWRVVLLVLAVQLGIVLAYSGASASIVSAIDIIASLLNAPVALFQALPLLLSLASTAIYPGNVLLVLAQHSASFSVVGHMALSAASSFLLHAVGDKFSHQAAWVNDHTRTLAGLATAFHSMKMFYDLICSPTHFMIRLNLTLLLLILAMKQWSFVASSFDFRTLALRQQQLSSSGITVASYLYFLFAPTLIFQISYPRAKTINWLRVLGLITQLGMIGIICSVLLQEWIVPVLLDHQHAFSNEKYPEMLLAALRLAMPSTLIWLLAVAYGLFHVHLNLVAELTMFEDRVFYGDWWNVSTVRAYWGLWNKPVSSFLKRHVLSPMKRVGSPYMLSYFVVFLISAVLHEVAVVVPFDTFRAYRCYIPLPVMGTWAFWGMIGQIPTIYGTDMFGKRPRWQGNLVFWVIFCVVGQPMAVLLYFSDVMVLMPKLAAVAAEAAAAGMA